MNIQKRISFLPKKEDYSNAEFVLFEPKDSDTVELTGYLKTEDDEISLMKFEYRREEFDFDELVDAIDEYYKSLDLPLAATSDEIIEKLNLVLS